MPTAPLVRRVGPHEGHLAAPFDGAPATFVLQRIAAGDAWLAVHDDAPIGYLRLERLWGRVPFVGLVRVAPAWRRRGVGRALLAAVTDGLVAEGRETLYSSSQADEPEPQAWHRRMGFVECGFLAGVNEQGVGEVFFAKTLVRPRS